MPQPVSIPASTSASAASPAPAGRSSLSLVERPFAPVPTAGAASPEALPGPLLRVVGAGLEVPLVTGGTIRYANLDYAASAPCLEAVADAVAAHLPWYASVHRGAGFASQVTTAAFDEARATVGRFVGARPGDAVVFTRNTTDALNLLEAVLPDDTTVVAFASEHHANLLPWRRRPNLCLPVPRTVDEALARAEAALASCHGRHKLLTVTGASNVTGELWPVAELGRIARRHGARLAVDAAQLAPHRPVDLEALGADYLALSGHKLYAPLGAGVLVGRSDWLDAAPPYLAGGGAVRHVTVEGTDWVRGPARHEAGTPNVLGAVALAAACRALGAVGQAAIAAHERALVERLVDGLRALGGVEVLSLWGPGHERIGVAAFRVAGWHHAELAAALGAEHGIGVRDGAFCAHPLVEALVARAATGSDGARGESRGSASRDGGAGGPCVAGAGSSPGAVRASLGVGSSAEDVDRLLAALGDLQRRGPRWSYRVDGGRVVPHPDPRPRPALL